MHLIPLLCRLHRTALLVACTLLTALLLALTALLLATPAPASASAVSPGAHPRPLPAATWPLDAPHLLLRSFEAPLTPYSAGHRGIDIAATTGQPVYAVAPGTVSFAGTVVDRPLVSITHAAAGSLISTLEPVTPTVAVGDTIAAGQQIGVVATSGHCTLTCVHLGVRLNGAYVSPLLLLGGLRRPMLLPLAPSG